MKSKSMRISNKIFGLVLSAVFITGFHAVACGQSPSRVSGYSATTFMAAWTDISATADSFRYNNNAGHGTILMPFDFPYDDSLITAGSKIWVCASGAISLLADTVPAGPVLDSPMYPGVVCIFSGNVVAGSGNGVNYDYYQVDGAAPNRVMTIQYHDTHIPGTGGGGKNPGGMNPTMMQVKFYETSGVIEFIYLAHNNIFETTPDYLCGIGLNGVSTPGFDANVYAANMTGTPPTDIRWAPGTAKEDSVAIALPFAPLTCPPGLDTSNITVRNTGSSPASYQAWVAGGYAEDFTILPPNPSMPVPAGGDAEFRIVFAPSANTVERANFLITNGPGGSIGLSAMGGAAAIAGSGSAGITGVGKTDTFTAIVNNTGTCDWTPGTITVSPPFAYLSGGSAAIPAGGSDTLIFTFTPTADSSFSSRVSFTNSIGLAAPAPIVTLFGVGATSGVQTISSANGYSLGQNYPNPFSGKSQMEFTLSSSGLTLLAIIDSKGEIAENVLDRQLESGTYSVTIDASGLGSGDYYCRMQSGGVTLMRQMSVVK